MTTTTVSQTAGTALAVLLAFIAFLAAPFVPAPRHALRRHQPNVRLPAGELGVARHGRSRLAGGAR